MDTPQENTTTSALGMEGLLHAQQIVMGMRYSGTPAQAIVQKSESLLRPYTTRTDVGGIALLELGKSYAHAAVHAASHGQRDEWWGKAKGCLLPVMALDDPELVACAATVVCFTALKVEPLEDARKTFAQNKQGLDEDARVIAESVYLRYERGNMIRRGLGTVVRSEGQSIR